MDDAVGGDQPGSRARPPGRPRDEQRREEILRAALGVFAQRGYAGATLKEIAAAAGLGSAAHLYHYFPRKGDLFAAVLVRFLAVEPMVRPEDHDRPPTEFIPDYLRRYLAQFHDQHRLLAFRLLSCELDRLQAMGVDIWDGKILQTFHELEAYVGRQVDAGRLADVDPAVVARAIHSQVIFHVQVRTAPFLPVIDDEVFGDATARLVLHGILPAAADDGS